MSNNLVINLHIATSKHSGKLPIRDIRSSSLRVTNISSSPKSASLFPYYPIPVPYSRIRSRRPCVLSGSQMPGSLPGAEMPSAFLGPKNSAIFYSKLLRPVGGIEPDLNGFLNQKQSVITAGRVKPQLNGLEGGIEPDLNYLFTPIANAPKVPFELDLFSQTRWSSGSKMPSVLLGAQMPGSLPGTVGAQGAFVVDSFRSRIAVSLRFPQAIHSPKLTVAFIDINSPFRCLILSCLNLPPLSVRAGRVVQINAARVKQFSE